MGNVFGLKVRGGKGTVSETKRDDFGRIVPGPELQKDLKTKVRVIKSLSLAYTILVLMAIIACVIFGIVFSYGGLLSFPPLVSIFVYAIPVFFMAAVLGTRNMVWAMGFWIAETITAGLLLIAQLIYFGATIYFWITTPGFWVHIFYPIVFFVSMGFWFLLIALVIWQYFWIIVIYYQYKTDDMDYVVGDIGKKVVFYFYVGANVLTYIVTMFAVLYSMVGGFVPEPTFYYSLSNVVIIAFTLYYAEIQSFAGFQKVHGIIHLVLLFIFFAGTITFVIIGFLIDLYGPVPPAPANWWVIWMILIANIVSGVIGHGVLFVFVLLWNVLGVCGGLGKGYYPQIWTKDGFGKTKNQARRFMTNQNMTKQDAMNALYGQDTVKVK